MRWASLRGGTLAACANGPAKTTVGAPLFSFVGAQQVRPPLPSSSSKRNELTGDGKQQEPPVAAPRLCPVRRDGRTQWRAFRMDFDNGPRASDVRDKACFARKTLLSLEMGVFLSGALGRPDALPAAAPGNSRLRDIKLRRREIGGALPDGQCGYALHVRLR
ncbi:hypothetical protein MTO96_001118 [Rhipicephalus appendiculatus]